MSDRTSESSQPDRPFGLSSEEVDALTSDEVLALLEDQLNALAKRCAAFVHRPSSLNGARSRHFKGHTEGLNRIIMSGEWPEDIIDGTRGVFSVAPPRPTMWRIEGVNGPISVQIERFQHYSSAPDDSVVSNDGVFFTINEQPPRESDPLHSLGRGVSKVYAIGNDVRDTSKGDIAPSPQIAFDAVRILEDMMRQIEESAAAQGANAAPPADPI